MVGSILCMCTCTCTDTAGGSLYKFIGSLICHTPTSIHTLRFLGWWNVHACISLPGVRLTCVDCTVVPVCTYSTYLYMYMYSTYYWSLPFSVRNANVRCTLHVSATQPWVSLACFSRLNLQWIELRFFGLPAVDWIVTSSPDHRTIDRYVKFEFGIALPTSLVAWSERYLRVKARVLHHKAGPVSL